MELRHLRSFVYVAENLSFSIAASRCCVTQSAISQHIKSLEDEMGCKLLIRTSHNITLTEYGEALLSRAKDILKRAADCKEYIHELNNCMAGELSIGVGSFIAPYIRVAALIFMERYPNVRLNAEMAKAASLNHLLRNHEIDIAFTLNTAYSNEGIESIPCIPFYIYAIMSNTHPLAKMPEVSYKDMLCHSVIMPDVGERVFNTFKQYVKQNLNKLNIKCIVSDLDEDLAIVEEKQAITFMPKLYLKNHPTLVARPITELKSKLISNAHYMQDVPLKRSARIFLDIIKQEAIPYINELEKTY